MTFRTNLQTLRARRNMTQEQLAMLLGVSRQAISKWESEKAYPEMDKLLAICDLFGCTLDDLVLGDVNRPANGATSDPTTGPSDEQNHPDTKPAEPAIGSADAGTPPLPQDLTGYDAHRRRFSLLIASGIAAVIAAVGIANLFDSDNSIIGPSPLNDFLMFTCIGIGVVVGLALLLGGGMMRVAFMRRHPYVQDFYTQDDRSHEARILVAGITGGIAAILIGVMLVVYMDEVRGVDAGWPNAVMLTLSAVGVFLFIYCGMRYLQLDIDAYNRASEEDRKERAGLQTASSRLTTTVCGVIMLVATIIAVCLLMFAPDAPFWLPWEIGGLLCGIAALVIQLFKGRFDQ
ncbi:helix-turn-helix domain-containing protein [Bifidobacterium amazonense]|uniref:Helix-turn-helix domain-containing protein n=1 Tax=Bifidobacterium amazonense TaxID=2809027 RepID=A0ABS9VUH8_9BIFI|nr:helix-turn-helix transcriptional regulator [Bifidobacterium amazonense]MCH9275755.1 helix-turn-helix domain-containing protein [Bifidobacterium amazonense]